jgi:serine/threonine-protein kinase RsbW
MGWSEHDEGRAGGSASARASTSDDETDIAGDSLVEISVPADLRSLGLVRAVVGAVAARSDLTYDDVNDLRLAVTEACSLLLRATPGATKISIRSWRSGRSLSVRASVDATADEWPPDHRRPRLGWIVMSGLVDAAIPLSTSHGTAIELVRQGAWAPPKLVSDSRGR